MPASDDTSTENAHIDDSHIEVVDDDVTWRFDRRFLSSGWRCIYGEGCQGILDEPAPELAQGCCSFGAHLGDGDDGRAEALDLAAYASTLDPSQWERAHELRERGVDALFSDERRTHTRVVDGACIFLNRPGFERGPGCALHVGALDAGESPIDWKPSVCWQLPIRVDWADRDDGGEVATVRQWRRADWGEFGETMAWCCTERADGGEAFSGDSAVIDELRDELSRVVSEPVMVELERRWTGQ